MRDPNPLRWIEAAKAGGYAVGAFNMHNDETAQALLQAAEQADAPVYLQVGRAIIPHMGVKKAYELTVRNAEESDALYTIHLDHGTWDEVLLAVGSASTRSCSTPPTCRSRRTSRPPSRGCELCHDYGIPVEAELGKIPDVGAKVEWASYYTDVARGGAVRRRDRRRPAGDLGGRGARRHAGLEQEPLAIDLIARDPRRRPGSAGAARRLGRPGTRGQGCDRQRRAQAQRRHRPAARVPRRRRGGWSKGDRQLEEVLDAGRGRMIDATVAKIEPSAAPGPVGVRQCR